MNGEEICSKCGNYFFHCHCDEIKQPYMSIDMSKLVKGSVVYMKGISGLQGYGNVQCISSVCEPLGTISLYGHNQHYKIHDIASIVEWPEYLDNEPIKND